MALLREEQARRKRLLPLLVLLKSPPSLTDEQLDQLDWLAAERESRPVRAIGTVVPDPDKLIPAHRSCLRLQSPFASSAVGVRLI